MLLCQLYGDLKSGEIVRTVCAGSRHGAGEELRRGDAVGRVGDEVGAAVVDERRGDQVAVGKLQLKVTLETGEAESIPGVERDLQPGSYGQATFVNDGRADFITNPTNGVTADQNLLGPGEDAGADRAHHRARLKNPYTWQSSIGFQKQINSVTGFDVDYTHWTEYRDMRTIDAN